MATAQQSSTETLFHQWRKGDAASGQAMAQRFTDWYFAIAASRLGEANGEAVFREACSAFSHGVGKITDARRLLGWAHTIARKQIHGASPAGRMPDGDLPSAFTAQASPKELLTRVRDHLPHEMYLLETAYRGEPVQDPREVLRARYAVKAFLKSTYKLPFRVTPAIPDPDRTPTCFYEAGYLTNDAEETSFELYMLQDMEVCQDIAEFAHFAIALRGGLPGETPAARPPQRTPRSATQQRAEPEPVAPKVRNDTPPPAANGPAQPLPDPRASAPPTSEAEGMSLPVMLTVAGVAGLLVALLFAALLYAFG